MKKISVVLILAVILTQVTSFSFAEDNFSVNHNIIKVDEELRDYDLVVPYFEGFTNSDLVNREIRNLIADLIGEANSNLKLMEKTRAELVEKGEEPFNWDIQLIVNYDYVKNGDILSIKLNTYYFSGGAHGTSSIYTITVNTETGEIYSFKDLFKEELDSNEIITKIIIGKIELSSQNYFEDYKETIMSKDGEYNYYIDGDKLVIYFDLYDIAPYAFGIPRFIIDSEEIGELLKDEVYNSIKDSKERGIISYNGENINSSSKIAFQDEYTPLVPLRAIAEILGYKVDWNREDGAIVNEVAVNKGIVVDGLTYVPIEFFTENLEENVVFEELGNDKLSIKVYSKTSDESHLNNLIKEFEFPTTDVDTVNMFAEAVKARNGAVQYGLLSDELRVEEYSSYNEMGFVTGVSSPWVDSYEIENIGDNSYKIVFNLKTSTPSDSTTSTVNIKLIKDGGYWRISAIK